MRVEEPGFYDQESEAKAYGQASQRWLFRRLERAFAKDLLRSYGEHEILSILDVGTGPAWIPLLLKKAKPGWKITGVDGSPAMLQQARENMIAQGVAIDLVGGNVEKLPFGNEEFDLVISHLAFHEFPKGALVLRELARVAKKGGDVRIRDIKRPPRLLLPFFWIWNTFYYFFSPVMREQTWASVRASYSRNELETLVAGIPDAVEIRTLSHSFVTMIEAHIWKGRSPARKTVTPPLPTSAPLFDTLLRAAGKKTATPSQAETPLSEEETVVALAHSFDGLGLTRGTKVAVIGFSASLGVRVEAAVRQIVDVVVKIESNWSSNEIGTVLGMSGSD